METKTILLPLYNGLRARSIFNTDIYSELVDDPGIRLIIIIPSAKLGFYREQYPQKNVIFEPLDIQPEPKFGRILNVIAFNLLDSNTIRGKQKLFFFRSGHYWKFFSRRLANRILGPIPWVKDLIRLLDRFVPLDKNVVRLLDKYKPSLVLIPDVVFAPDRIFSRAAKRAGYYIIAMARSWDNLVSKGVIQILPNKLVVYTPQMVKDAIKLVGMPPNDVALMNPPQFDMYFRKRIVNRRAVLKKLGIPSSRRVIVCAPFFDGYIDSGVALINNLTKAIDDGQLSKDTHILVRYRPATEEPEGGAFRPSDHLTITRPASQLFSIVTAMGPAKDHEWTKEDVRLLIDTLYIGDIVINAVSTLSIDAAVLDKPVINIRFDADPHCPPKHSVTTLLALHDHYKAVEASKGVRLVWSMPELIRAINDYLQNPRLDSEGRERLRQEQIGTCDGLAGKRIADYIKQKLIELTQK